MKTMDKSLMERAFPERGARFDEAIDSALAAVHADAMARGENAAHADEERARAGGKAIVRASHGKRARQLVPAWRRSAVAWALVAVLLCAGTLGVAQGVRRGVFGFLWGERDVLPEAAKLVRQDMASVTLGGTEIAVTESAYDGATLRLVMSVRVPEIERKLLYPELDDEGSEFCKALARDGVSAQYSFDLFTLNGEEHGMTGGSGGENAVGEENGEMLIYFELNLLGIDVPEGEITVGLPVGRREGETVMLEIPAKASDLESVRDVTPEVATMELEGGGTLTVVSARLSPIAAYATVRLDFPEGAEDEAAVAFARWQDFTFVDENGKPVCPYTELTGWGLPQGENDPALHFEASIRCKAAETYPDDLFLAYDGANGENMMRLQ